MKYFYLLIFFANLSLIERKDLSMHKTDVWDI